MEFALQISRPFACLAGANMQSSVSGENRQQRESTEMIHAKTG